MDIGLEFISVRKEKEEDSYDVPLDTDGTLSLALLHALFPNALGLEYSTQTGMKVEGKTGCWNKIELLDNKLLPPHQGWGISKVYIVLEGHSLLDVIQEKEEQLHVLLDKFHHLVYEERNDNYEDIIDFQENLIHQVERYVRRMENDNTSKVNGNSNSGEVVNHASDEVNETNPSSQKVKSVIDESYDMEYHHKPDERRLIYVCNVNKNCSKTQLKRFLESSCEKLIYRQIVSNDETPDDPSIRYAVVRFASEEAETKALQEEHEIDGVELSIRVEPRDSDIGRQFYRRIKENYYKKMERINREKITEINEGISETDGLPHSSDNKRVIKRKSKDERETLRIDKSVYNIPRHYSSSAHRFKECSHRYSSKQNDNRSNFNQGCCGDPHY